MNALKHGERSAENIAARRELGAMLRIMRNLERDETPTIDCLTPVQIWLDRIATELNA
jgi:hypothetical protein